MLRPWVHYSRLSYVPRMGTSADNSLNKLACSERPNQPGGGSLYRPA